MNIIIGIIVGLAVLTILVALHELGHALAAKKNGVKLKEYAIGFPPRIKSGKTKTDKILPKGTKISLGAIPLGGFVMLQGEHDSDNKKGDYGSVSFWAKTQILLAGVMMNWLVAIIIFTILAITGMPQIIPNQYKLASDYRETSGGVKIETVSEASPAQKAGLKKGDKILKINNKNIVSLDDFNNGVKDNVGKKVEFRLSRENKEISKNVELRSKNNDGKGYVGIVVNVENYRGYSTWSAPMVGVGTTIQLTGATFKGLGDLVVNFFSGIANKLSFNTQNQNTGNAQLSKARDSVAGPVAILGVIFPSVAQSGIDQVLLVMAIISISLACMNILPIPALDGGRWFLTFIFRVLLKKPLSAKTEENINAIFFLALMGLSVFIIILDFARIFKG